MLLNLMHDVSALPQYLTANSTSMTIDAPEQMLLDMKDAVCVEPSQPRQKRVRFQEDLKESTEPLGPSLQCPRRMRFQGDREEPPKATVPSSKKQRRVRFPEVEWQEIALDEALCDETHDKTMLWYQKKELFRIKWNNQRMLREYRLVSKHIQQSSLVPQDQNHYSSMKHRMEMNMRGLEIYRSKRALVAAKQRRDASQRIVLLEQQHQKRKGITDPKRIRQASRSVTQTSKVIAYAQGKKDALFVGKAVPSERMTQLVP
jgi:hypothetical protein